MKNFVGIPSFVLRHLFQPVEGLIALPSTPVGILLLSEPFLHFEEKLYFIQYLVRFLRLLFQVISRDISRYFRWFLTRLFVLSSKLIERVAIYVSYDFRIQFGIVFGKF